MSSKKQQNVIVTNASCPAVPSYEAFLQLAGSVDLAKDQPSLYGVQLTTDLEPIPTGRGTNYVARFYLPTEASEEFKTQIKALAQDNPETRQMAEFREGLVLKIGFVLLKKLGKYGGTVPTVRSLEVVGWKAMFKAEPVEDAVKEEEAQAVPQIRGRLTPPQAGEPRRLKSRS